MSKPPDVNRGGSPEKLSIRLIGNSSRHVVDPEHLCYRVDEVRFPSGLERRYAYVDDEYSAATVVPVDRRGGQRSVFLVRQERYPSQSIGWEVIAGQPAVGESQFDAGQRELREEGGLKAGLWQPLPQLFQMVGRGNTRSDAWLVADVEEVQGACEANEVITEGDWFSMDAVDRMMLGGEINSAHTAASLAVARAFLDGHPDHPISILTASTPAE